MRFPFARSGDVPSAQIFGAQAPSSRFGHLFGTGGAIEQVNRDDVFIPKLGGMKTVGARPAAVEGDGASHKHEDAPAQSVHDNIPETRASQPGIGGESKASGRLRQWLPIVLAIPVLSYYVAIGSWPGSKMVLTWAMAAITARLWAARRDRRKAIASRGGL